MPPALNNRNCECGNGGSPAISGLIGTNQTIITGTTTSIVGVVPGQIAFEQEYFYQDGTGPYTHTILLPVAQIANGCTVGIFLSFPESTNPTAFIQGVLPNDVTQPSPGGSATNYLKFVFNGTVWRLILWS